MIRKKWGFLSAAASLFFVAHLFSQSASAEPQTAGISGTDFPYWQQTENQFEPERTCSLTSLAMITDYYGLTNPKDNGRTPDYLFRKFGGVLQTVPALERGFNQFARDQSSPLRVASKQNGTIDELRLALAEGKPVVIHGWFTPSGHIVVVTGFDGVDYIVNDPNGRWNEEKWGTYDTSVSGQQLRYSKSAFEYAINDNGTGDDLWLHIFPRANRKEN